MGLCDTNFVCFFARLPFGACRVSGEIKCERPVNCCDAKVLATNKEKDSTGITVEPFSLLSVLPA